DLEELLKPIHDWLRRHRPVGLLPREEPSLILLMKDVVRFIVFIKARVGSVVHILQVCTGETLRMAPSAGLDPGIQALIGPVALDVFSDTWHEGIVGPTDLTNYVVSEFPLIFHVTALASWIALPALGHRILELHVPIPLSFIFLVSQSMLGPVVGFPVVMVGAAVAGAAGFRLP